MEDHKKTKAQLIEELTAARQALAHLQANQNTEDSDESETLQFAQEQFEFAETLRMANIALHSSLNYESVLDCVLDYADSIVAHDAACLMLVDRDIARIFRWHGYTGYGVHESFATLTFNISEIPVLSTIQQTGHPCLIPAVEAGNTSELYIFASSWVQSHIGVPIRLRDDIIGILNLDSATPDAFTQTDANHLQAYADQVAVALLHYLHFHHRHHH
ncbi:MAG: GAF domain-containing protein, partial [Chloroflexota bacterium]